MKNITVLVIKISLIFIFLTSGSLFSQSTYNISDPKDLENQTYLPGDEIILANGNYSSDDRIDFIGNGTASQPIIFRAASPGGVKFTGGLQMNIGGDYVVVDGFHWQGGYGASNFIQFRNGTDYANHSTIQNCVIDSLLIHPDDVLDDVANNSKTKHRWIVLYGTYNSVLNCSFMNKESAGALILAEYQYNAENDSCGTIGHTISNNYFYRYKKIDATLSNSGDSETIRIGTSEYQNVNSNAIVSNNYFVEADGENEIITNKSKGNTYTNNTFRRCRGSLVLRHGSHATVERNYFLGENIDGTGGIRITDSEHSIRNNYIQDCINIGSQAKWNNGITFLGGGTSAAVPCTSTSTSNGYQKSENIDISNNSIVNTNAPLFYNTDKGSTDPTGTVSNNLIYFNATSINKSDILTGDTPTSYADLGITLTYTGNIFKGSTLGETNTGFSLDAGITATTNGEIFIFSGGSSASKGADMGAYVPTVDSMVGHGIGACFLNHLGATISNGNCTITINEYLTLSTLPPYTAIASSNDLSISSNISWTAVANDAWITLDTNSGNGNSIVSVSVTKNTDTTSRVGTITFTQDPGGTDIIKTLSVIQNAANLTDFYELINTGTGLPSDQVKVHSFSKEEVNGTNKFNYAKNTLDKDNNTVWAADDGAIIAGDYKGDGEYIIYDLDTLHNLNLIQFSTTNKSDAFGFQIWVSTTGIDVSDFSKLLPAASDLLLTTTNSTKFNQYEFDETEARYVKLVGFGRYNNIGDTRTSVWSAIGEIEFYGNKTVSLSENKSSKQLLIYPVPSTDIVHLKNMELVNSITIYNIDGNKMIEKEFSSSVEAASVDVSTFPSGSYLIVFQGKNINQSSPFIISR